jgi:hypothetical protein
VEVKKPSWRERAGARPLELSLLGVRLWLLPADPDARAPAARWARGAGRVDQLGVAARALAPQQDAEVDGMFLISVGVADADRGVVQRATG